MFTKESDYSFCSVVGRTDVGCKRVVNEDSIGRADTPNGLAVVICDGMGGNVGGKTASETAVSAILMHLREHAYNDPKEAVNNAILEANRAVLKKASLRPELTGMGCTCVLLLVSKSGVVNIGHIGDSRIYLIRDGLANQLTKDQSYVQMLVDEGKLTPEQAEHHPRNNEITNAVGMMNMTPPVVRDHHINPVAGDCFLLCSDGLSKLVPEGNIVKIVSARSFSTERRAEMLIDAAKNNGGSDNISVQLVEFSVSPAEVRLANDRKHMIFLAASAVLLALLVMSGFFVFNKSEKEKLPDQNTIIERCDATSQHDTEATAAGTSTLRVPPMQDSVTTSHQSTVNANNVSQEETPQNESLNNQPTGENEEAEVEFNGEIKIFPSNQESFEIKPPRPKKGQDRKYSRACCKWKQSDSISTSLEIKETNNGGLIIKKTKPGLNWKGFSLEITEAIVNDKLTPLPEKSRIKIVFE